MTSRVSLFAIVLLAACSPASDSKAASPTSGQERVLASARRLLGPDLARPMHVAGTSVHSNIDASAICPRGEPRTNRDLGITSEVFSAIADASSIRSEHVGGGPKYAGSGGSTCSQGNAEAVFDAEIHARYPHQQIWQLSVADTPAQLAEARAGAARRGANFIVYDNAKTGCLIEVMIGAGSRLAGVRVTIPAADRAVLRTSIDAHRPCITRAILLGNGLLGARMMSDAELTTMSGLWRGRRDPLTSAARIIFATKIEPGMPVRLLLQRLSASPLLPSAATETEGSHGPAPLPRVVDPPSKM